METVNFIKSITPHRKPSEQIIRAVRVRVLIRLILRFREQKESRRVKSPEKVAFLKAEVRDLSDGQEYPKRIDSNYGQEYPK